MDQAKEAEGPTAIQNESNVMNTLMISSIQGRNDFSHNVPRYHSHTNVLAAHPKQMSGKS